MSDVERWLARAALERRDHPALICGESVTSYGALERCVRATAGRLRSLGLEPADRLALLLENDSAFVYALHAAMALGCPIVPLNARLGARELRPLLRDAAPRLLLCDAARERAARAAAAECPGATVVTVRELAERPVVQVAIRETLALADDQALLFTSGTTGRPKGVRLSFGSQLASALQSAARLGVESRDRWLVCMPLSHTGGLAIPLRQAIYGTAVVLLDRFDPRAVAHSLAHDEITLVSLVPTMLSRLLPVLDERPPDLRCVLLGGGPIPPDLVARARERGLPIARTYGLTEAASQVATSAPGDDEPGLPALAATRLRIADAEGKELSPGTPGEILVSGPQLMAGYLGLPEESARALREGWLSTGDFGWLDRRERLHLLDRRRDLVVTGGENVYPSEVEAVLVAHPEVADAAVLGRSDPEWGQIVVALVVPAEGSLPQAAALQAHCREHLAGFKVPRRIELRPTLPRTPSGKLERYRLA